MPLGIFQLNGIAESYTKAGVAVLCVAALAYLGRKMIDWYEKKDAQIMAIHEKKDAHVAEIQKDHGAAMKAMNDARSADLDKIANVMSAQTHIIEASAKAVEANTKVVEQNTQTIVTLVREGMRGKSE